MALVSVCMRICRVVFLILTSTIYTPQPQVTLTSHPIIYPLIHLLIHHETKSYGITTAAPALSIWTAYLLKQRWYLILQHRQHLLPLSSPPLLSSQWHIPPDWAYLSPGFFYCLRLLNLFLNQPILPPRSSPSVLQYQHWQELNRFMSNNKRSLFPLKPAPPSTVPWIYKWH